MDNAVFASELSKQVALLWGGLCQSSFPDPQNRTKEHQTRVESFKYH